MGATGDDTAPELPADLLDAPEAWDEPCSCDRCGQECVVPEPPALTRSGAGAAAVNRFAEQFRLVQRHTALMWREIAAMVATVGSERAEFVSDDLALVMNVHPRTAQAMTFTAVAVAEVPVLLQAVQDGEVCDRHVSALLEEAASWTADPETARQVVELTVERCQDRLAQGLGWPTPAQLRRRVRTAAMLLDLQAAEKAKKNAFEKRGVSATRTGTGRGQVVIEGPDVSIAQIMDAIRARAEALGRLPGNQRTLDQRLYDAAHELLTADADGGESDVPTLDDGGRAVTIRVRGVEVSVLVPFSVARGGDLEVAEIQGYGPILPSTARGLLAEAERVRRIAVDAETGRILSVDERVPGPRHERDDASDGGPDGGQDGGPAAGPDTGPDAGPGEGPGGSRSPDTGSGHGCGPSPHSASRLVLERLSTLPVIPRDLSTPSYRVPGRLRRRIELRDRVCQFPGCTVPGQWCDIDHRDAWPHGPTDESNLHCLCRRHHRAKQAYFEVEPASDGGTTWITPDRRRYRTPAPFF